MKRMFVAVHMLIIIITAIIIITTTSTTTIKPAQIAPDPHNELLPVCYTFVVDDGKGWAMAFDGTSPRDILLLMIRCDV